MEAGLSWVCRLDEWINGQDYTEYCQEIKKSMSTLP